MQDNSLASLISEETSRSLLTGQVIGKLYKHSRQRTFFSRDAWAFRDFGVSSSGSLKYYKPNNSNAKEFPIRNISIAIGDEGNIKASGASAAFGFQPVIVAPSRIPSQVVAQMSPGFTPFVQSDDVLGIISESASSTLLASAENQMLSQVDPIGGQENSDGNNELIAETDDIISSLGDVPEDPNIALTVDVEAELSMAVEDTAEKTIESALSNDAILQPLSNESESSINTPEKASSEDDDATTTSTPTPKKRFSLARYFGGPGSSSK